MDLVNQKFGMLTALRRTPKPAGVKHRGAWWECLCECGKTIVRCANYLKQSSMPSCGCHVKYSLRELAKSRPRIKRSDPQKVLRRHKMQAFCNWRLHARKRGIPFSLKFEELPDPPAVCPVLGIPMGFSDRRNDPSSVSMDRFRPELGYVDGNVQWISYRANTLKNNATVEEIKKLAAWMEKQRG